MAHLVLVDSTASGVPAISAGVAMGHRVSVVGDLAFDGPSSTPEAQAHLAKACRVLPFGGVRPDDLTEIVTTALAGIHQQDSVDGIVAVAEAMVLPTAIACERLGLRFTARAGIEAARQNDLVRDRLAAAGLASVRHAVVAGRDEAVQAAATLGFPLIAKPRVGQGRAGVALIRGMEDLDGLFARRGASTTEQNAPSPSFALVLETVARGRMVSCAVAKQGPALTMLMITERKWVCDDGLVDLGATMPAGIRSGDQSTLETYVAQVLDLVGLDFGVFHLDVCLGSRGPVLVEINPRSMGAGLRRLYGLATGHDFFEDVIAVHLGQPPRQYPPPVVQAATSRAVIPRTEGRIRDDLPADWLGAFPDVDLGRLSVAPGQAVSPPLGSVSGGVSSGVRGLGVVTVTATSPARAAVKGDETLYRLEQYLGVPLYG